MSAELTPVRLLTNEAGLTFGMLTPVVLAGLTLFHPTVNPAVLRVTSFAGSPLLAALEKGGRTVPESS